MTEEEIKEATRKWVAEFRMNYPVDWIERNLTRRAADDPEEMMRIMLQLQKIERLRKNCRTLRASFRLRAHDSERRPRTRRAAGRTTMTSPAVTDFNRWINSQQQDRSSPPSVCA